MAAPRVKRIWIEVKYLHRPESSKSKKPALVELTFAEDSSSEDVKSILRKTFRIKDASLILRIRNHRDSLVPVNGAITKNQKSEPYTLEVVGVHQNIPAQKRSVLMTSHEESLKQKLQNLEHRVTNLEHEVLYFDKKREEKVDEEMEDIERKLLFLNGRIDKSNASAWQGMFKRNPMW